MKRPYITLGLFLATLGLSLLAVEMPCGQSNVAVAIGPQEAGGLPASRLLADPDFALYFASELVLTPADSSPAAAVAEASVADSRQATDVSTASVCNLWQDDVESVAIATVAASLFSPLPVAVIPVEQSSIAQDVKDIAPGEPANMAVAASHPVIAGCLDYIADAYGVTTARDGSSRRRLPVRKVERTGEATRSRVSEPVVQRDSLKSLVPPPVRGVARWQEQPAHGKQSPDAAPRKVSSHDADVDDAEYLADCFPPDFFYGCLPYAGPIADSCRVSTAKAESLAHTEDAVEKKARLLNDQASLGFEPSPHAIFTEAGDVASLELPTPSPWDEFAHLIGCTTPEGQCGLLVGGAKVGSVQSLVNDDRHSTGTIASIDLNQRNQGLLPPPPTAAELAAERAKQLAARRRAAEAVLVPVTRTAAQIIGDFAASLHQLSKALDQLAGLSTSLPVDRTADARPSDVVE